MRVWGIGWRPGCHPLFRVRHQARRSIHGAWSRGEQLAPARAAFEERGYTAHTPTLRYHELPLQEGAVKVASLSLRDYTDDLVAFVNSLDSPPLLVGHSMGGLLAQLVAARTRHAGLVAACPGPAAGILDATRTSLRMSLPHLLRPRPWTKPWPPRRSSNFDAGSLTRRPRTSPGRYMTVGLRIRALPLGTTPCGTEALQGHRRRFHSGHRPRAGDGRRVRPHRAGRSRAPRPQPGTNTGPPLRFPAPTIWCFQGRHYRSL